MKKIFLSFLMFMFTFCTTGCFASSDEVKAGSEIESEPVDPIEEILASMTLEEKVGQMVMIGVYGLSVNDDTKNLLSKYHFGGIIFYDRNMENKAQVKDFVDGLNSVSGQKLPLFVALDEEGGRVARMKHDLTAPPSQQSLGETGNPENAKIWAKRTAAALREIGVNVNFAPVADVGGKDTRSFADNPQIVSDFVSNAVAGYEEENFYCCLKHFPGIGAAKIDPHKEISSISFSRDELEKYDLLPFRNVIKNHDNSKFMVMISHLSYDALDPGKAASLSKPIVTDLLRNDIGFTGVIITDDLNMGAVSKHNSSKNMGVESIKAGADIALLCHEPEMQKDIYSGILEAVQKGEISEERIDESVRRILKMKFALR